jgi:hypothetical protein
MPGGRKVIWVNGRRASVPEDQFENTLRSLSASGMDFDVDDPSGAGAAPEGVMTVGEPEVIKTQHGASGDWGPDEEIGFMDRFSRGLHDAGQWIKEANDDGIRGFNQGATWGGSDELAGVLGGNVAAERAANRAAQQRSPVAYNFDRALGMVPGLIGGPATAIGRTALATGEGFVGGALSSDSNDLGQTTEDALQGALTSGLLSGGSELVRGGLDLAKRGGQKLIGLADEVRNQAFGGTAGDYQKAARMNGLDYVEGEIGQRAREMGLTNKLVPQSPSRYARKAEAMKNQEGQAMGSALDEAGETIATYSSPDELADRLRTRGAGQRDGTPEGLAEENRLNQMADLLLKERGVPEVIRAPQVDPQDALYGGAQAFDSPQFIETGRTAPGSAALMSPAELNAQKSNYYGRGYKAQGMSDTEAGLGQETNRIAGQEARGMLLDSLNYGPEGAKARYEQSAQNYGELATIGDMARNRASANQAQGSEGFFGTLMRPATQMLKNYGPDLSANVMTLAGQAPAPFAGMAQTGARMTNAAAPAIGGMAGTPPDNSDGLGANVRGYMTPDVAKRVMQQNPMAFGPYTQQFQTAAQSQDPTDMVRLLDRLETTDPEWQPYLQQLLQMTGQQGGM